jgi:hypothetical protein
VAEIPNKMHAVYAQDWYEFDPDYWNPLPDRFTAYHISVSALLRYAKLLYDLNEKHGSVTFEEAADPYTAEVDEACYREVKAKQTVIIRAGKQG